MAQQGYAIGYIDEYALANMQAHSEQSNMSFSQSNSRINDEDDGDL